MYRVRGTQVTLLARDLTYEPSFTGGVRVTTADIDGDGLAEIVTAPGAGRESWVRVLKISGNGLAESRPSRLKSPALPRASSSRAASG